MVEWGSLQPSTAPGQRLVAMRLFAYKMTHDTGFAPNPFHGACTLATCKPQIRLHKRVGDWIAGFTSKRLNGDGSRNGGSRNGDLETGGSRNGGSRNGDAASSYHPISKRGRG
jgi:hypothetical protein